MNIINWILNSFIFDNKDKRMSVAKEEMENFFSVLAEREKQFYIAKERYEESLKLLEKIYIHKKEKFIQSISFIESKVEPAQPIIDKNENELKKFDNDKIPDKNLLEDIKELLKKIKKPLSTKEIHEELIVSGRKFSNNKSLDMVCSILQSSSNNSKGVLMIGRDKWGLDEWVK